MMKTLMLSSAVRMAITGAALAKTLVLKGATADRFIAKYHPGAEIPGPVKGAIRCKVPAMGARSNGEVSTCVIRSR